MEQRGKWHGCGFLERNRRDEEYDVEEKAWETAPGHRYPWKAFE